MTRDVVDTVDAGAELGLSRFGTKALARRLLALPTVETAALRPSGGTWSDALPEVLAALDVDRQTWNDAADAMGDALAFIALLAVDRKRGHPTDPISDPGAALRALAADTRAGHCDLGSLLEEVESIADATSPQEETVE